MSMSFTGSYLVPAPRGRVWEALNDPDVLARAIPGCESLTAEEPGRFRARVAVRLGVVNATFDGRVTLDPVNPPEVFALRGEAGAGLAGAATGGAEITLVDLSADETRIDYVATADITGRVAMVGGRLIQSVAARLADKFFAAFAGEVGGGEIRRVAGAPPAATETPESPPQTTEPQSHGITVAAGAGKAFFAGIAVGIVATVAAVIALSLAG